jgi:hypothetical protein
MASRTAGPPSPLFSPSPLLHTHAERSELSISVAYVFRSSLAKMRLEKLVRGTPCNRMKAIETKRQSIGRQSA